MIPIFISVLFGLLNLLLTWLMSNRGKLNDRQKRKVEHALFLMSEVRQEAALQGLSPTLDPEEAPLMAAEGWNPLDKVYSLIGGKTAARVRQLLPDFPGTQEQQDAFFAAEVKRIAES